MDDYETMQIIDKRHYSNILSEMVFTTKKNNFFEDLLTSQSDNLHNKIQVSIYNHYHHSKQIPHEAYPTRKVYIMYHKKQCKQQ